MRVFDESCERENISFDGLSGEVRNLTSSDKQDLILSVARHEIKERHLGNGGKMCPWKTSRKMMG